MLLCSHNLAAFAKLDVRIPIKDLINAIRDEDEEKGVKLTAEATQRRATPSERKLAPQLIARSLTTNLFNASSRSQTN